MTKVYCADMMCKFNNNEVCTNKKIELSWRSIMTLHDGRKEFNRCKSHEMNKRYRSIDQGMQKIKDTQYNE